MSDLHVGKIEILAQATTGRSENEIEVKTDVDYYGTLDMAEILSCLIHALYKVGGEHGLTRASILGRVEDFDHALGEGGYTYEVPVRRKG